MPERDFLTDACENCPKLPFLYENLAKVLDGKAHPTVKALTKLTLMRFENDGQECEGPYTSIDGNDGQEKVTTICGIDKDLPYMRDITNQNND